MRFHSFKLLLLAAVAAPALAQRANTGGNHPVDLGLSYTYLRSNVLPGGGGLSLNGGSLEAGVALTPHFQGLADLTLVHRGGITPDGYTLTQLTYTFGVRVFPLDPRAKLRPFVETLFGGDHVIGTLAPVNAGVGLSNDSFALQLGGGITYKLSRHFTLRPVQADYVMTTLSNNARDRQNDLRLSSGINYRFSRH